MKKLSKEKKRRLIFFIIKIAVFLVVGLTIWLISAKKQHETEKDIGENIVADEIEEGVEIAIM